MMEFTICRRCVMDTSDSTISFDSNGDCNHCLDFDKKNLDFRFTEDQENHNLEKIYDQIKKRSKNF